MIHDLVQAIFSHLCHQEAGRCWAPGGAALALCQRCTGVYAGAALGICMVPIMRFKPEKQPLLLHFLFIIQMIPFGMHWIPHGALMRMLTGQLFIYGVIYFLVANISTQMGLIREDMTPRKYYLWLTASLIFLQILVRLPFAFAAPLIELMALAGLLVIIILILLTITSVTFSNY